MSEADDRLGVQRQLKACRDLADRLGLQVAEVIEDNDLSATRANVVRPGFERLLKMAAGTVVIVWHTDRLVRKLTDLERVIDTGLSVHAVEAGAVDLSTASGRAVARTLTTWAQFEGEHRLARQKLAQSQALAAGRRSGGRRPFGFSIPNMEPIAEEAEAVRLGYAMLLRGEKLTAIARAWNEQGLRTPQSGAAWSGDIVRRTLKLATHAGLRSHKGRIVGDAAWPGIVDRATWEAAQAILADPSRRANHKGTAPELLTGVARCGVCGATINAGGARQGEPGLYRCSAVPHLGRRRAPIDAYVLERVSEELESLAVFPGRSTSGTAIDPALGAELEALERQLDTLAEDLELSTRVLAKRTAAIEARIQDLRDLIGSQATAPVGPLQADLDALLDEIAAAGGLANLPVETQRRAVQFSQAEITIHAPGRGVRNFDPSTVSVVFPNDEFGQE
jgi:DNA invertase Pin-like site-specific DNA recombinase